MFIFGRCFVLLLFAPKFGTRSTLFAILSGDIAFVPRVGLKGTYSTSSLGASDVAVMLLAVLRSRIFSISMDARLFFA